ncbi:MAG: response regulator [Deltaproteobacteria bacterium]|nr:response regulator [Deltaproteobacteria bacterium]MBN2670989.1 response regulator [Deltaproteobacteria bacterium]
MTEEKRILVVDDEAVVRDSLEQYLEDCDFEVQTAESAISALQLLKSGACFDIAVVDIRMPEMNGEDFMLAAHEICGHMKFLIQTGTLDYRVSAPLQKLGIQDTNVLKKPVFELNTYVEKIEQILNKSAE